MSKFDLIEHLSPMERIKYILKDTDSDRDRLTRQFTQNEVTLKSLETFSPTHARGVFAFKVSPYYCNPAGNLHGGAQATFFDVCTSMLTYVVATKKFWVYGGVSRTLTVNFLRPAPEGLEVEMVCEVVQIGGSLALIRGELRRAEDGVVLSTCEHTKAAVKGKL